ncbi:MAG TPA: nitroreductase family deazaflavin-dependent oxidoreductase [Candidatus Limnocylindrales bacterium]|nr:nitroreductase family deazaflavin-dependent oxidoreductase [Candidatus Limnocylindrales bacterium]
MTAVRREAVRTLPRPLIRTFWMLHRAAYRLSGGRFGLSQPAAGGRFGMMRLATLGRRSGKERVAIVGYFEDGPNLVTLAMNGWGSAEPAWWLNLQADPRATVDLPDGTRAVRARAATGTERARLWARFDDFPGWGDDIDAFAARRPTDTAVVVLEPRPGDSDGLTAIPPAQPDDDRRRRLRLRHLWIVPGLAIAVYANLQAQQLGLGILPLLAFGIAPDLPRLLGIGQPHAHGQMAARAVPAYNLMHHPLPPVGMFALGAAGVLPPVLYVGALAWLGHIVLGLAIGDRMRGSDGRLAPLWPGRRPAARSVEPDLADPSRSAERAA